MAGARTRRRAPKHDRAVSLAEFGLSQRLQEALDPGQRLFELLVARRERGTNVPFARRAEGTARDDCHLVLEEQALAEFLAGEAARLDRGKGVEGAVRL